MIKADTCKNGDERDAIVNIHGSQIDLICEAISVCCSIHDIFVDFKEGRALTDLACKVLRGEVEGKQWQNELVEIGQKNIKSFEGNVTEGEGLE